MGAADQPTATATPAVLPPRPTWGCSLNQALLRVGTAVDNALSAAFYRIGRVVGRRPWTTILLVLLFCAVCGVGFLRFEEETDGDKLFTPTNAPSQIDGAWVRSVYGTPTMSFRVIAVLKSSAGGDVLTKPALQELLTLQQYMENGLIDDAGVAYADVCVRPQPAPWPCRTESVLAAWNASSATIAADADLLATLNAAPVDEFGEPLNLAWLLGGVTLNSGGAVAGAKAYQIILNTVIDDKALAWVGKLSEQLMDSYTSSVLSVYPVDDRAVESESDGAIQRDITLLSAGYMLIICWSLVVLSRNSWAYTKTHLIMVGTVPLIGLSLMCSFGVASAWGFKFNVVTQVMPFLIIGLGVDNTFVITGAYFDRPDPTLPPAERIAMTLKRAGPSVLVTSATDVIAFSIGAWTDLPALLNFSVFAFLAIFFCFVFHVTYFAACLALEARREAAMLAGGRGCSGGCAACCFSTCPCACCGPCRVPGDDEEAQQGGAATEGSQSTTGSEADPWRPSPRAANEAQPALPPVIINEYVVDQDAAAPPAPQKMAAGGDGSYKDDAAAAKAAAAHVFAYHPPSSNGSSKPGSADPTAVSADVIAAAADQPAAHRTFFSPRIFGRGHYDPRTPTFSRRLIGEWLPRLVLGRWGVVVCLLIEAAVLSVMIYGCTQVYMDFNYRKLFTPSGSKLSAVWELDSEYFQGDSTMFGIYTRMPVTGGTYFDHRAELAAVTTRLQANPYVADVPGAVRNWHDALGTTCDTHTNGPDWMACVKSWLDADGLSFKGNVKFDAAGTTIISSRIDALSKDLVDGSYSVNFVKAVRADAAAAAPSLDAFAWSFSFPNFDGLANIAWSTIRNVIAAACAVLVMVTILLANAPAALAVLLQIVLVDVQILGFMWWTGLTFNTVTCINLVLAVGVAVDYSAHVAHSFMVVTGSRRERAAKALQHIGADVFNGGFTTFLGVVIMVGAKHYIFKVFFLMWTALVLSGLWHGLVILPILLRLFGPPPYASAKDQGH